MEDKFFEDDQLLKEYTDEIRSKICTVLEKLGKENIKFFNLLILEKCNLWSNLVEVLGYSEEVKRLSNLIKIYRCLIRMSEKKNIFSKKMLSLLNL